MENWITDNWFELLLIVLGGVAAYIRLDTRAKNIRLEAEEIRLQAEQDKVAARAREENQRLEFNQLMVRYGEESIARNKRLEDALDRERDQQAKMNRFYETEISNLTTALNEQIENNARDNKKRDDELKEAQQTIEAMGRQIQVYEAAATAAQQESTALRQEVAEFNQRVNGLNVLLGELTGDLKKIREERDALKKDLEKAQGQIEHLEKLLIEKNNEIKELQDKVTSLELQRALEEPAKETAHEPAPTNTSAVESASAEPTATQATGDSGGAAA